eukprot:6569281-Prymnesium_polylepis.1
MRIANLEIHVNRMKNPQNRAGGQHPELIREGVEYPPSERRAKAPACCVLRAGPKHQGKAETDKETT